MSRLLKLKTKKSVDEVLKAIRAKASDFEFIIREEFDMAEAFKSHGVNVDGNFVYHSIMLCNPQKAYEAIFADKIRGAVLLPPKQLVIYPENGKTVVAYNAVEVTDVSGVLPDDKGFQKGLAASCSNIVKLMESII